MTVRCPDDWSTRMTDTAFDAPAHDLRRRQVDPICPKPFHTQGAVLVVAEFADIARPPAQSTTGRHGRGRLAARQRLQTLNRRLAARRGVGGNHGQHIDGIEPEADGVERSGRLRRQRDGKPAFPNRRVREQGRALIFAFCLHIVSAARTLEERLHAAAYQTPARDFRFSQRVHRSKRIRAQSGRDSAADSACPRWPTVHKHLTNLQEKGFIRRAWNRSRSVELVPSRVGTRAVDLPLLGNVAAGAPIEAVVSAETVSVPEDLVGKADTYALRVRGNSMIDEADPGWRPGHCGGPKDR